MATLKVGSKVLVTRISLSFSDYKNLDGVVTNLSGEFATVAVPKNKISAEDLRDLRKDGERALIKVKITNLA